MNGKFEKAVATSVLKNTEYSESLVQKRNRHISVRQRKAKLKLKSPKTSRRKRRHAFSVGRDGAHIGHS